MAKKPEAKFFVCGDFNSCASSASFLHELIPATEPTFRHNILGRLVQSTTDWALVLRSLNYDTQLRWSELSDHTAIVDKVAIPTMQPASWYLLFRQILEGMPNIC